MAPGPLQIAIVILLVFLVFGASRLPNIAENLAKGIKSFKGGLKDDDQEGADAPSEDVDASKQAEQIQSDKDK